MVFECCAPVPKQHRLVVLSGTNVEHVAAELAKSMDAQRLSSKAVYLPGNRVPIDIAYPDLHSKVNALGQTAAFLCGSGFNVILELHDEAQAHIPCLSDVLKGTNVIVTNALTYAPLYDMHKVPATPQEMAHYLIQFGVNFEGSPSKTPNAVAYVTRGDVEKVVRNLEEKFGNTEDAKVQGRLLKQFLFRRFHITDKQKGAWLSPRGQYDAVVSAAVPAKAAAALTKQTARAAQIKRASVLQQKQVASLSHPLICPLCSNAIQRLKPSAGSNLLQHQRQTLPLCSQCLHLTAQELEGSRFEGGVTAAPIPQVYPPFPAPYDFCAEEKAPIPVAPAKTQ